LAAAFLAGPANQGSAALLYACNSAFLAKSISSADFVGSAAFFDGFFFYLKRLIFYVLLQR